ncbi:MAG TPA: hypothetical protein VIW92_04775, partial [Thermoanaerobaculia bacterium]
IWTPAGPPGTHRYPDFADQLVVDPFSPSTLYLVYFGEGSSGAWRSVDGGASWTSINVGLGTSYINSLVADPFTPGTLYALVGQTSVYRSTNHGETWTRVFDSHAGAGVFVLLERIVADPTTPGSLWGSHAGLIYRSADGGATWSQVGQLGESGFISGFVPDPKDPDVLYASSWETLWRSEDRGATWTDLGDYLGRGFEWIEIAPSRPATIYARTTNPLNEHPGCLRSDDSGATWTSISFPDAGELCTAIVVDPQNHLRIWALSPDTQRFFASTDGGETWEEEIHDDLPEELALFLLRRDPRTGVFYMLGPNGVFRSADGGATWQLGNGGLTRVVLRAFLPLPGPRTILLAGVGRTGNQLVPSALRSRNRGRFCTRIPLAEVTALEVDPKDPSHVLAAGILEGSPNLQESRDRGITWRFLGEAPAVVVDIAFHPRDSRRVLIGTQLSGVFQSRDGGRTWQASSAGIPFPPDCDHISCQGDTNPTYDISFDPQNPNKVLAIFDRRLILRSENGGWRWSKVTGEPPVRVAGAITLERDPRRGEVVYAAGLDNLFKSLDGGATWRRIGGDFRPAGAAFRDLAFDPRNGGVLYAATTVGVFRSLDGGNTWEAINEGLGILDVLRLEIDPNVPGGIFASTDGAGIWSWEP